MAQAGSARGSTVCESSVDAALAGSGQSDEGEDVFLLDDYDLEGQSRGRDVEDTREKVWARSSRKSSFASRLLPWRCAHMQCDARPWSKGALFCRVVKRPFWILVAILYAECSFFFWIVRAMRSMTDQFRIQLSRWPRFICLGQRPLRPR